MSWTMRVSIATLLVLSLAIAAGSAAVPFAVNGVDALDDEASGDIDEGDDNSGHGNDDDGVDQDTSGKGNGKEKKEKKDKADDEDAIVTAVPTATSSPAPEITTTVLAPESSATATVLTPATSATATAHTPDDATGALTIHLRACPPDTDPAAGTQALHDACPDGWPDATFKLGGRTGPFAGWRRDVDTDSAGDATVADLAEGTYSLTLDDLDWCAAEASSVADGLIVITAGKTTDVTAYLCGAPATSTAAGR